MSASRFVVANGLQHHLRVWGEGEPVLLLHGYLDLAASFERVGLGLAAAGWQVLALDFRGHGETDRAPEGSYYHFPDYLADVVGVLDALGVPAVRVVAHSMGGSVATMLAGAFPERVTALALLEGIGPPAMPAEVAPDRTRAWIEGVPKVRARGPRVHPTMDEVRRRLQASHPTVPEACLLGVAERSVRAVDGGYVFLFDPLHQTLSPNRFDAEGFEAYAPRITCPVLLVDGGEAARYPDYVPRAKRYATARSVELPGAGHMMHWTRPEALIAALVAFLRGEGASP
ncbi:MAG: alpha/beta hydrolase [Deltaproteobacteria bacterium]|nr:alpha/beta hydrolase [Deltaproteobacteria bacterium]